jgi:hypothetical protein
MLQLSGAMETPVERDGDRLVVRLAPPTRGVRESTAGEAP